MRKAYCFILILLACSLSAMSQELVGKVSDSDSSATPLYPAEITLSQGGKVIATYKTFFDGTYHLKVRPSQIYQITASYPGRKDTTIDISVDRNGTLVGGTLFITLRKNGLRLMGYVMDREEDVPIKDAGIVIRNVMTRKEEKYFTDVDGYYNLKMDFETNYTFRIDKRSPGIINKYQDTSFNISTIGFNKALDFRFDIKLGPAEGFVKARPQYDPYAKPENKNLKPVIQVMGKKDSAKIREQAAALAELDKKLNSKDSAIASLDKKISDISKAKKDDKLALNTAAEDQKKKEDAALLKAEKAKQQAEADAKKKEQEKAAADLKAKKQGEEAKRKADEKAAADLKLKQQAEADAKKKEQEKADDLKAKQLAAAEAKKKEQEKTLADLKAKQKTAKTKEEIAKLRDEEEKEALIELENERKQKIAAEQKQREEQALKEKKQKEYEQKNLADKARIDRENAALAKADSALAADKLKKEQKAAEKARKQEEDAATAKLPKEKSKKQKRADAQKQKDEEALRVKQAAEEAAAKQENEKKLLLAAGQKKKKEEEELRAKQQSENQQDNTVKIPVDKETAAINRADSALLADKLRKEQRDRDIAAMKKAREDAEAKGTNDKREKEAKEKMAKKQSKRIAKELAEQAKEHKKSEEANRKLAEEKQRIARKKAQTEAEQRELEAKRELEEQEKKKLISEREKLISDQQVRVAKNTEEKEPYNNSAKSVHDNNQKKLIADYETKIKDEKSKKASAESKNTTAANAPAATVKLVKTKGYVKNGQTEDPLTNVSINIRRLNGIVSQEVTSDDKGNYEFTVDSGYFYLVSFYKDRFEISKQILDLTSYKKPEYTMLIQYLKEHDEFDPAAKMPLVHFDKNSSKLPDGLWSELEPIVKMMQEVPQLKMKLYGLGSADEDYPMELAVTRARLVADVMLESGIKPARIRINGIGALRPRSGCVEGKQCTEDQYKMDRVVMYKVIKE